MRERKSGQNIYGKKINSLLYADDIMLVLFGAAVTKYVAKCERYSRDYKYESTPDTCKVVPPVYSRDSRIPVKVYGEPLKEVTGAST